MVSPSAISWAARIGLLYLAGTPLAFMGFRATPYIFTLLAVGELIIDKRISTLSRTVPFQFIGRIFSGALVGSAACFPSGNWLVGTFLGVVGALAGTFGGAVLRRRLASALGKDLLAALMEDAAAITLSVVAIWRI